MSPTGPAPENLDEIRVAAALRTGWRRAQTTMNRALAASGLSGFEYHLLLAISAAGQTGSRQVDLALELGVPEGKVSVLAQQLRERGLVEALRSEPDRRYVRLRLRPAGWRILRTAMRCQREELAAMAGRLPEQAVIEMVEFAIRTYLGLDMTVRPRRDALSRRPPPAATP